MKRLRGRERDNPKPGRQYLSKVTMVLFLLVPWQVWVGFRRDDLITKKTKATTIIDDIVAPSTFSCALSTATPTLINHTVVMGQFNFEESIESVVFWHAHWRKHFQHVVVAGPFSNDTVDKLESVYNIKAFAGRADKGFSSPMENMNTVMQHYFNLKQQQMDGDVVCVNSVEGVLYFHDDALVNITELRPWLGSSTTIIASADTSNPRVGWNNNSNRMKEVAEHSYSIMSNRTVAKVDGYHTDKPLELVNTMSSRWRWRECIISWDKVTMDPDSHAFREPDGSFLIPRPFYGGADFLYVPLSFTHAFSKLATLLMKYQVFLECGFSKLVDNLRQNHNATAVSVPLCTTFFKFRGKMDMIKRCSKPLVVVHPLKLGVLGLQNWSMAFERIVNHNQT
jgi:hypothetical protein